jgi:hypothetical protein
MVSISRYFYVQITEPIDYVSYESIPYKLESLECVCDLDTLTINIDGKKYDLLSFINAAQMALIALKHRNQEKKYQYYMHLESRKV